MAENIEQLNIIKAKLDEWIGLSSELVQWQDNPAQQTLYYKSSTNILLFTISLRWHEGAWQYGYRSVSLPANVDQIRQLITPIVEQKLSVVFQTD